MCPFGQWLLDPEGGHIGGIQVVQCLERWEPVPEAGTEGSHPITIQLNKLRRRTVTGLRHQSQPIGLGQESRLQAGQWSWAGLGRKSGGL